MGRLIVLLLGVLLPLAACANGDGSDGGSATDGISDGTTTTSVAATSTTVTTPGDAVELANECETAAYVVRFPEGWHTNDGAVVERCSYFDAEPIEVEPGTEPSGVPVILDVEPVAFDRITEATETNDGIEIRESSELTIDGRRAMRVESVTTEQAPIGPAGREQLQYFVDLGETTLVATARGAGQVRAEQAADVLERMIETLDVK